MQGTVTQALGQEEPLDKEASKPRSVVGIEAHQFTGFLPERRGSCLSLPDVHIEVSPPCSECGYSGSLLCNPGPQLI